MRIRKAGFFGPVQIRSMGKIGKHLIYDLEKDPHEICNLINDPAYRKDINRLRKVYRQWERKYWQCRPLTEPEIVQTMWPDGVQPLVSAPQIVQKGGRLSWSVPLLESLMPIS